MKKLALILVVVLMLMMVVAGCGGQQAQEQPAEEEKQQEQKQEEAKEETAKSEYKDGVYIVKGDKISHGNFPFIKIVIKDGKIAEVDYREYIVETGKYKTEGTYPYKESPIAQKDLEKQLLEKQDVEALDLDATSGATHSKEYFVELAKAALEKAKKGEAYEPKFKDGEYSIKADEPSHGWLAQMTMWIEDGMIVGVDYDEIAVEDMENERVFFDENGNVIEGKTEPVTIKKGDEKSLENYKYWYSPKAMEQYEHYIVMHQGVEGIEDADVVSGATHTKERIVEFAKELISRAKK